MTDHPITPPPELLQEWCQQGRNCISELDALKELATQAARWGADQELEACCEWLHWQNLATHSELIPSLRTARRPKPPSLKEKLKEAIYNENLGDALRLVEQYGIKMFYVGTYDTPYQAHIAALAHRLEYHWNP
jgi:hypothetical protein